jgi:hypothetical protein
MGRRQERRVWASLKRLLEEQAPIGLEGWRYASCCDRANQEGSRPPAE